jgi:1-deoxy-D-xylulose-5-phosphate synthase
MSTILENVNFPEDIRGLNQAQLTQLCKEIRELIINTVLQNGGHLASNLGTVELTLALHLAFNTPKDKILWDVGHQTYTHKIITGRKGEFRQLRQNEGLSGFPKPSESVYDTFGTGHASTAISAALGVARARDLRHEDYQVVAVVGDGALTGGMCFEGMNDAGHSKNRIIIILNDNKMSIAPNVGALSTYLTRLRADSSYHRFKDGLSGFLKHVPLVGKPLAKGLETLKNSIKYSVIPGALFEEYGFQYLGPVDGHNIKELCKIFKRAKDMEDPVLIHVITQKGRGYENAELDPQRYHGVAPFFLEKKPVGEEHALSFSTAFGLGVTRLAQMDERIVAVTAAMTDGTGLRPFQQTFPERFFDVGIAEEHAVTMAAGMASQGLRPFVAVYSTFMQRAYDQIIHDVCLQRLPVTFGIDRCGPVGEDGETHHGIFDISYLRSMPNLTLVSPQSPAELMEVLKLYDRIQGPLAIRYPKGYGPAKAPAPKIVPGRWEVLREGADGMVLAVGQMVPIALEAARLLAGDGYAVGVCHARFIKPLDEAMLSRLINRSGWVFTLEDNVLAGGFGSAVLEYLEQRDAKLHIQCFGFPDTFLPQMTIESLFDQYGLTSEKLKNTMEYYLELEGKGICNDAG